MLTELLARLPEAPKQVFVCGSNPFVEAAADATIAAGVASGSDPHRALWRLRQLRQRGQEQFHYFGSWDWQLRTGTGVCWAVRKRGRSCKTRWSRRIWSTRSSSCVPTSKSSFRPTNIMWRCNKLDELLAAIRPLEIVEATVVETPRQEAAPRRRARGRYRQNLDRDRPGIGGRRRRGQGALGLLDFAGDLRFDSRGRSTLRCARNRGFYALGADLDRRRNHPRDA